YNSSRALLRSLAEMRNQTAMAKAASSRSPSHVWAARFFDRSAFPRAEAQARPSCTTPFFLLVYRSPIEAQRTRSRPRRQREACEKWLKCSMASEVGWVQ